jgi:hypothetical protein
VDFNDMARGAPTQLSWAHLKKSRPQRLFDSNDFVADMFQLNLSRRAPSN